MRKYEKPLTVNGLAYTYFDIASAVHHVDKLPYALRILAEGVIRNLDGVNFTTDHLEMLNSFDGSKRIQVKFRLSLAVLSYRTLRVYLQLSI